MFCWSTQLECIAAETTYHSYANVSTVLFVKCKMVQKFRSFITHKLNEYYFAPNDDSHTDSALLTTGYGGCGDKSIIRNKFRFGRYVLIKTERSNWVTV